MHRPPHPGKAPLEPPGASTRWCCPARLGTKDQDLDPTRAPPPRPTAPAELSSGEEGEVVALHLLKLGDPGRMGKVPRYLRGHKRQIHGVTAPAAVADTATCAGVFAVAAAVADPAACTAGRERAEQRAGAPRSPRRPRALQQSRRGDASRPALRPQLALGSLAPDGEGAGPLELAGGGAGRGGTPSGTLHVTTSSPTLWGRAWRTLERSQSSTCEGRMEKLRPELRPLISARTSDQPKPNTSGPVQLSPALQ